MATDTDRLVVQLEARVRDFEKNFSRATRTSDRDFGKIENRAKKAADRVEHEFTSLSGKTMGIGKNMALGLVAGFTAGGLTAIMSQIGNVTRGMAQIGDEARRAGLSTTAFQELRYVAEQNRVGVDALVDGFKELSLRTAEFVTTGGGSAADAFTRLGYTSEELAGKMADPSALFTEIIGKLGQMDRASAILNADEIFGGTGGEQFVQLIEQGEAALNRTRQEAHDLGLVMSDELIAKADELDRRFNMVANTVGSALKAAIVGAAAALMDFINTFNSMPGMINLQGATAPLATRGLGVMQNQRASKQAALDGVLDREGKGELSGWFNTGLGHDDAKASLSAEIAELTAAIDRRQDPTQFDVNSIFDNLKTPTYDSVDEMQTALAPPKPLSILVDGAGTLPTPGGGGGGRASSMREEKDAAAALIAELQRELTMIGMSEAEKRVDAELRKAGASATDDQKTSIRGLVQEIEAETAAMDQLEAASDSAKGMAKNFLGGLLGDLRNGVDGATALANAFVKLADQLIDMAVNALIENLFAGLTAGVGGAGGGLLGGILKLADGGEVQGFASGGHVRGTGTGRSDSIPAALSNGEFVVNSAATARNRALLEAINAGKLGKFADGGLVGNAARSIGSSGPGAGVTIAPTISVKVEGGSRGEKADQALGDDIAKKIEGTMRAIASDELRRSMRPGNIANTRSR
ncbi:hypothetical protein [Devosia sp. A449]